MSCISGINKIYIAPFTCYKKRLFDYNSFDNTLLSIPTTIYYEVDYIGKTSASSNAVISDNGYYFDESISINTNGLNALLDLDITQNRTSILLELNDGSYTILGLFNGLKLDSKTISTGTELNEYKGFVYSFKGSEYEQFLKFDDLSSVGIGIAQDGFLTLENGFYLLQENGDKIIL